MLLRSEITSLRKASPPTLLKGTLLTSGLSSIFVFKSMGLIVRTPSQEFTYLTLMTVRNVSLLLSLIGPRLGVLLYQIIGLSVRLCSLTEAVIQIQTDKRLYCFNLSIFGEKPMPGLFGAVITPLSESVIEGEEKSSSKNLLLGKMSHG